MITTKRPTDDMIQVAIVSMEEALVADGEAIPTGSAPIDREPMPLGAPRPGAPKVATVPVPGATIASEKHGPGQAAVQPADDSNEAPPLS
jgi:hypothetical protein